MPGFDDWTSIEDFAHANEVLASTNLWAGLPIELAEHFTASGVFITPCARECGFH
jgi:hypothetical protein